MKTRVIVPVVRPPDKTHKPDTRPIIARGMAAKRSECLAMGPTPGCCGRKALVRGDATRKPRGPECRQRIIEWLKKQDDPNVQARLASAQGRQELQEEEDGPNRKRARMEVMSDNWVSRDDKATRQHREPRRQLFVPGQMLVQRRGPGKKLKNVEPLRRHMSSTTPRGRYVH